MASRTTKSDHAFGLEDLSRQAVILVGGKGSRLGALTKNTPKPLMPITDSVVFLDLLLDELIRQGFSDILLLAGYLSAQLDDRYKSHDKQCTITVIEEKQPLGTGGALLHAAPFLADRFLLLNGDTWFDFNWRSLEHSLIGSPEAMAAIALLPAPDEDRYGRVILEDGCVTAFAEKQQLSTGSPMNKAAGKTAANTRLCINGGAYFCRKTLLNFAPSGPFSLETELMPDLVAQKRLKGIIGQGYFIDIGLPETLAQCRADYPDFLRRPALFLDRDGTLNHDDGYTHKVEDCRLIDGAADLVRFYCDRGWLVLVVTNQAGVGKGLYDEEAVHAFHAELNRQLVAIGGGMIHDFAFCPFTPAATLPAYYAENHPDRKPNEGMLLRLADRWPINMAQSLLIGDLEKDVVAAQRAGIDGYQFVGPDLWAFASSQNLTKEAD